VGLGGAAAPRGSTARSRWPTARGARPGGGADAPPSLSSRSGVRRSSPGSPPLHGMRARLAPAGGRNQSWCAVAAAGCFGGGGLAGGRWPATTSECGLSMVCLCEEEDDTVSMTCGVYL
jgi:hypothetical protein